MAIQINDPDDLAEFGDNRIEDGFLYCALIKLSIPHQGILPARPRAAPMRIDVASRHRTPQRGGGSDSD